ncbi:uncharacterized protein NPIL_592791 [Nephila pilipes]|uniref:Uncharacterized protein n=1 Tax=Nephila pilipes TaxID=299642 RepID=A0A8X6KD50_NEPPI|nr:uncharacterized protein NPIL_592791 [Nephila pilipes]
MAAAANHDFWKDAMRREERIRNKFKKKLEPKKIVEISPKPVYHKRTEVTTVKKESFYTPSTHKTTRICKLKNVAIPPSSAVVPISSQNKSECKPVLHLVKSPLTVKKSELAISYTECPGNDSMIDNARDWKKVKHQCRENTVVENTHAYPVLIKERHCKKTLGHHIPSNLVRTLNDPNVPTGEGLLIIKERK